MKTWQKIGLLAVGGFGASVVTCVGALGPCWSGWFRWGVLASRCPVGVVPTVQASVYGVGRGVRGSVNVSIQGELFDETLRPVGREGMSRASVDLVLVAPDGTESEVEPVDGWDGGAWRSGTIILPKELPDGDYVLRVTADTPSGEATAEVPIGLYRPALAHVLTSAPLYKPGQTVQFRAVILERGSFKPLGQRPGKWIVRDPSGQALLEEKSKTDDWGIASSDFPVADDADAGSWLVEFRSGEATDRVSVEVKQFELPKMVAELSSAQAYWRVGEAPKLEGTVRYASGAPVANAALRIRMAEVDGWPPPLAWTTVDPGTTDAAGAFSLTLDAVPEDVIDLSKVSVTVEATDATGETVRASTALVLTLDPLDVQAVTELGGGLVPNMNNRMFVRATSPDGRTMPEKLLRLRPAWDPSAPWIEATTDGSGVARFQLDPGAAVTVVEPVNPVRPPPPKSVVPVRLGAVEDELDGDVSLAERAVVDRWVRTLGVCGGAANGEDAQVEVIAAWSSGRRVLGTVTSGSAGSRACVERALDGLAAPGTGDSLLTIDITLHDPGTPWIEAAPEVVGDAALPAFDFDAALLSARPCARTAPESASLPGLLAWSLDRGASTARVVPLRAADESPQERALFECVVAKMGPLTTDTPAIRAAQGTASLDVNVPASATVAQPAPSTWPGFEFVAQIEGVGETKLRIREGAIPPLRLRLDEVIVDPGATVGITAVRGPDFHGTLPEKLELRQGNRVLTRFDVDPEKRVGSFKVPDDATGFASIEYADARAVVYIRSKEELSVELSAPGATWKPGSQVELLAKTTNRGAPVAAGLTLSGVDATMGQLATLVAPDDFSRVTVQATMAEPVFGVLDAKALQSGMIAGENAQQATVLRIASLPPVSPVADSASGEGSSVVDIETPLSEAFFRLYREARKLVLAWEAGAPAGELLTNERMADLWGKALDAQPAEDPFGRKLRLRNLPADLLSLTEPRVMVADAARLPEDIENWATWVAKERP